MNTRAFTLSLVIALLAMGMVWSYIEGIRSQLIQKYGQESSVVVAKVDIDELDLLDDTKVTIKKIPQNYLAPGHIKDIKSVFNTIATVPIRKGEQITKPRITHPGARTGLSRQVSVGKRAFSISVNKSQAVSKLIKPGDRVDIVAIMDYSGGRKELLRAKTILQDVLVLSTGLSITNAVPLAQKQQGASGIYKTVKLNTYTDYNTVTLELAPFQVQKLILTQAMNTTAFLSLRNNDDKQIVRIKGTRLYDLLEEDAAEAKAFFSAKNKRRQ